MAETQTQSATSADFYAKLKAALGKRESGNNYMAVNQFGYLGKYQFGAAALIDLGYLVKDTSQQMLNKLAKLISFEDPPPANASPEDIERFNAVIALNRKYWTGKDGVYSTRKGFLERGPVQEKCMDRWLVILQKTLIRIKVIDNETTAQESGGFICSSHLIGCGGARDMKNGIVKKDGNGVTGNEYYKLGYAAISGAVPTVAPSEAKKENPARETSTIPGVGSVITDNRPPPTPGAPPPQATSLPGIGFSDPTGTYPKYEDEPDTSRLMRHQNIRQTIVPAKDNTRLKDVRIANGGSWDQPPISYNSKYPYNQVLETESGHVMEFDDTPENERVHIYHKTGTFTEIDRNGTQVTRIVGDGYTILDRNGYVSISGTCYVTVEGDANLVVKNDLNLEVNGNLSGAITGSASWNVEGSWNVTAYGGISNIAHGGYSVKSKSGVDFRCADNFTVKTDSGIKFENLAKFEIDSKGEFNANSEGNMILKTFSDLNLGSRGRLHLTSIADTAMDANRLYLNSGISRAAVGVKKLTYKLANWQPPYLPASLNIPTLSPLTLPPRSFETVADFDDSSETTTAAQSVEQEKLLVQSGLTAVNPLPPKISETPVVPQPVTEAQAPVISTCSDFKPGQINTNDYISKNFTLKMLLGGRPLPASQSGFTDAQLACNLKNLAVNVLDPIKAKYADMIITSGFRPMGSNPNSQHPMGMAADMQFPSVKSADYIIIASWIVANLKTDQCILEYRTNSANSRPGAPVTWIHVSFSTKGNRGQYFTMNNDKRISDFGKLLVVTC